MWTVAELGLQYKRHDVGGSFGGLDTDAFEALNPNRLIPVIDDAGFVLYESQSIVRYLCRQYDHGGLCPKDAHRAALCDQWMQWCDTTFMPVFFPIFWALIRTEEGSRDNADIKQRAVKTGFLLQLLEKQLAGSAYLMGDTLTMADIPIGAMMFKYFTLDIERPSLPQIEAWYERLKSHAAYREHAMLDFGKSPEQWRALELASMGS